MKYVRLSREQFESLHEEFSLFLATQSIDKKQWDIIKKENPKLTDELLDVYSDMIWDHSLEKITYLENKSDYHLFLFKCEAAQINLILIRLEDDCPSLMDKNYKNWLAEHLSDPRVSIFESSKTFEVGLKTEKFNLINKGAVVSDGKTFEDLKSFLSKL